MMNKITQFSLTFKRGIQLLGNLQPSAGSTHPVKRVGRGASSGYGKTSGRGTKGQKARGKAKSFFEGGQTPIYKLFPKIGFKQPEQREYSELTLDRIAYFYKNGKLSGLQNIDMKCMVDIGLVTGIVKPGGVKIIGGKAKDVESYKGKLPSGVVFESCKSTANAIKAIEQSGSKIVNRFYSELNLRALLKPEWFLEKYSRLPLPSRPTKRKDIEYYTSFEHRGYLSEPLVSGERDVAYANMIKEARERGSNRAAAQASKSAISGSKKKNALELQIERIRESVSSSSISAPVQEDSKIIELKNL